MTVEQRNFAYYDAHYRAAHPLLFLLHGALSFDQRSKTRPNLALLEPALRGRMKVRVLDYGSGFGTLLLGLPRHGFELYAYDLSERAVLQLIAAARYVGREVRALRPDDQVDVIVCSHVLEHVPSDSALLQRFAAALRPAGLLLVNVPINELWNDPKHARAYTEPALRELLEHAGFHVIETRQVDRVSAWLCSHEQRPGQSRLVKMGLRVARLLLGRTPPQLLEVAERAWLQDFPPQQLLALCSCKRRL
jgi:2-polyprenyl-3-methyl-5-hydroxy-6-metoxy-1,4-benzoquinol methylase